MRTSAVEILRIEAGKRTHRADCLAVEEPLTIRVSGEALSVTMRTPGEDEELVLGFLYGEGVIQRRADILQLRGEK
ncbi:formate dehydrogenase accessory sulfurtransferase FdhD [Armatimonas sp.]|uniref:formate dehydrogenase accessory sulfurtransferase FdhD n=1 Tax=Armatimonas sp. TaxID=1872638 RepID=UPI00375173A6